MFGINATVFFIGAFLIHGYIENYIPKTYIFSGNSIYTQEEHVCESGVLYYSYRGEYTPMPGTDSKIRKCHTRPLLMKEYHELVGRIR